MIWQDTALSIGNFVLALALLPSIFSVDKPALKTSGMTTSILYAFGIIFATLGLWLSAIAVSTAATLWLVLLIQVLRRK